MFIVNWRDTGNTLRRALWFSVTAWGLLVSWGFSAVPHAPASPYAEAYLRGNYQEALDTLEGEVGDVARNLPTDWALDRAELLFILGRGEEALVAMRDVAQSMQEPYYTVRLAEMLRELGRYSDADQAAQWAFQQNQAYYAPQQFPRENLLALGRLVRLRGENPNRVLQIYQQRLLARDPNYIPGFVEAGELALASYGYDIAEEYFLAALALDDTRQDALAGLAETYWKAGDPRFEAVRERLEGLNPHHPRLQCMVVSQSLAADDRETAERLLDDLLSINASHREGLAYRAALAFLKDDADGQAAALKRLSELDPLRGDGFHIVGEVAARHYRFEEAVELLRTGVAVEPDNVAIQSALGLNLLRIGEDEAGRAILEEAFEEDRFNVQIYNMLEVLDSMAAFDTLNTPAFDIRLPETESQVMGKELTTLLDEAIGHYEDRYDVAIRKPVHVQIFDDHDEFMVRSVGLPGNPGHLGICFGDLVTLDSPRARPPRSMNWRAVLWHEFVHVITLQKTNNRIPRWLSEGISVYEEGQRDPAWGQPLLPDFKELLEEGVWPGVADLEAYFVRPESATHLIFGYFLAGEFVQTYVDAFGMSALLEALDAMGRGDDAAVALTEAAGESVAELDTHFAAHLKTVCRPLRYLHRDEAPSFLLQKIERPSFFRIMEAGQEAAAAGDTETAIAKFEKAATLYPAFPDVMNPYRQLVTLHHQSGDTAAWAEAVMDLCRYDATAFEEPLALLDHAVREENWEQVLTLVDWCIGIDPFDLSLYAQRRTAQEALGQQEGLLETLALLARQDEANTAAYQLASAETLLSLARREEARRTILEVLEAFPEYRAAQVLLLSLHEESEEAPANAS